MVQVERPRPMSGSLAHWRRCIHKRAFLDPKEADSYRQQTYPHDATLHVYRCPYGEHFHIGHSKFAESE